MEKNNKSYRPSNGSEGMWFEEKFCMNCIHCNPDPEGKKQCDILFRAWFYESNEDKYPKEWQYDEKNEPTCTSWTKWDWLEQGEPTDDDIIFIDPNQLKLKL